MTSKVYPQVVLYIGSALSALISETVSVAPPVCHVISRMILHSSLFTFPFMFLVRTLCTSIQYLACVLLLLSSFLFFSFLLFSPVFLLPFPVLLILKTDTYIFISFGNIYPEFFSQFSLLPPTCHLSPLIIDHFWFLWLHLWKVRGNLKTVNFNFSTHFSLSLPIPLSPFPSSVLLLC